MAAQHLTIDQMYEKFGENKEFYIAHFASSNPELNENPYSDTKPYKVHLSVFRSDLSQQLKIVINSHMTQQILSRNPYFSYICSENLEEVEEAYEMHKRDWIVERRRYLNAQLAHLVKMEESLDN